MMQPAFEPSAEQVDQEVSLTCCCAYAEQMNQCAHRADEGSGTAVVHDPSSSGNDSPAHPPRP